MIEMVWKRRGIYPSLQKVLKYFLKKDCTALSKDIKSILTKDFDLMQCFEAIAKDAIPEALDNYSDDLDDLIGKAEFKRHYKAFWNFRYSI